MNAARRKDAGPVQAEELPGRPRSSTQRMRITYEELRRRVAASRPTWLRQMLDGPAPHPRIAALALHALIRIGADTDDHDVVVAWDGGWVGMRRDRRSMMFESDEVALASGAAYAYSVGVDFDAPLEELGQ